jgi:hypothetical protein
MQDVRIGDERHFWDAGSDRASALPTARTFAPFVAFARHPFESTSERAGQRPRPTIVARASPLPTFRNFAAFAPSRDTCPLVVVTDKFARLRACALGV